MIFTLKVVSPKYKVERVWDGSNFTKDGKPRQCKYVTKRMKQQVKYYRDMGHKIVARVTGELSNEPTQHKLNL